MTRGTKSMVFGAVLVAAAAFAVPAVAKADRFDRDRHDWHDRDRGGRVNVDLRAGGGGAGDKCGRPPVIVDRPQQVWVEPVYRTVCDRVWVEPVYQTTCEKVWREPVVEKRVERIWVPESRVVRDVRHGNRVSREWVYTPAHFEEHCEDVVVSPGHWEDVRGQVLVSAGHWQNVDRQELVTPGHWETRVERVAVAAPEPRHDGVRIDLRLPFRW